MGIGQIVQETLPESIRGRVNGTWRSFYAIFDTLSFVFTLLYSDPIDFDILCLISFAMVSLAMITFSCAYIIQQRQTMAYERIAELDND